MLRQNFLLVAGVMLAVASPAHCDGIEASVKDAPVVAESYVWDGLYAGVGLGIGSFDHDGGASFAKSKTLELCKPDYDPVPLLAAVPAPVCKKWSDSKSHSTSFGDDDWDVFATLQVGYDRIVHPQIIAGVFADLDLYADSEHGFSDVWKKGKGTLGDISGDLDLQHVWNVGGRLGYLVTQRLLIYGVGGYSEASVDGSIVLAKTFGDPQRLEIDDELRGYFVGGGGEIKLDRATSLKFEYRYADYDGSSASAGDSTSYDCGNKKLKCTYTKSWKAHADLDAEIFSVRMALVFRLDEPAAPVAPLK